VLFTVVAASDWEAREAASLMLRRAWKTLHVDATPGVDFDLASLSVKPA
jgi:hypothetical protein